MTTWLVRKSGSDNNGGTSASIRSTDVDGVTAGTNTLTSVAAKFVAGDLNHGIFIGGVNQWRLITLVNSATSINFSGATIASGSGRTWTIGGAFQTFGKVAGSTIPIASGDQSYIGTGVFRENIAFGTTFTSETKFTGDIYGQYTGDAGVVELSGFLTDDRVAGSGGAFGLNTRNFVTAERFWIITNNTDAAISSTTGLHDITLNECVIVSLSGGNARIMNHTTTADIAANWIFNRCIFFTIRGANIVLARPSVADFDYNIQFNNCVFPAIEVSPAVGVTATGANTFNGGGVREKYCTIINAQAMTTGASTSTNASIACSVYNSLLMFSPSAAANTINANALGQILEDYNIGQISRTNVTAGVHTQSFTAQSPKFEMGQSFLWAMIPRPMWAPVSGSPLLGFGAQSSSPTVDLLNTTRPYGTVTYGDRGTATAGGANSLTDSTKAWGVDAWRGAMVRIRAGTGSGQVKRIISNTTTALVPDGAWITNPDSTSQYFIYFGPLVTTGKATAGSTTTLTDTGAAWGATQLVGMTVSADAGTGSGQTAVVTSHTATVLTFAAVGVGFDNTTQYSIYQSTGMVTGGKGAIHPSVGALERPNGAFREATTFRTAAPSWGLAAGGQEEFEVPVAAVSTTISVWAQYDAYYAGTLPQLQLLANGEIGVAAANATCVGASGSFEQLQLTFTPTAAGKVKVRFASLSTAAHGLAFFDDWSAL